MTLSIDRRMHLDTLPNGRDLGGLPVATGTVARNLVFRSASLSTLDAADSAALVQLDLVRVIDLRTDAERQAAPNRLPEHATQVHLDVFAESSLNIAAQMGKFAADPSAAMAAFSGGQARDMLISSYHDLVNLPSAKKSYAEFFELLADPENTGATIFHCTAGKDRTGWGAAILLFALGASYETVLADYLQTNTDSAAFIEPLITQLASKGLDADGLREVLGVDAAYLDTALSLVKEQYGSVETYILQGLLVPQATLDAVRQKYIEAAITA